MPVVASMNSGFSTLHILMIVGQITRSSFMRGLVQFLRCRAAGVPLGRAQKGAESGNRKSNSLCWGFPSAVATRRPQSVWMVHQ
jgi:hypothetical protein